MSQREITNGPDSRVETACRDRSPCRMLAREAAHGRESPGEIAGGQPVVWRSFNRRAAWGLHLLRTAEQLHRDFQDFQEADPEDEKEREDLGWQSVSDVVNEACTIFDNADREDQQQQVPVAVARRAPAAVALELVRSAEALRRDFDLFRPVAGGATKDVQYASRALAIVVADCILLADKEAEGLPEGREWRAWVLDEKERPLADIVRSAEDLQRSFREHKSPGGGVQHKGGLSAVDALTEEKPRRVYAAMGPRGAAALELFRVSNSLQCAFQCFPADDRQSSYAKHAAEWMGEAASSAMNVLVEADADEQHRAFAPHVAPSVPRP